MTSSLLEVLSAGIDLRTNLADSSVKMHIRIGDYPEKLATAFILSDGAADSNYLSGFVNLIGFDFYFNGKSEIEIYAEVREDDFFKPETINQVWQHFPKSVLKPLHASSLFFTGLSKANHNPVLYYHLKNKGSSLLFMLNQQTRCQDNILLTQKFRKFLKP